MRERIPKNTKIDYDKVTQEILSQVESYLIRNGIKAVIIGVSGGLDSGINTVLLSKVCQRLKIPLIGRFIHIETNKEEERLNAQRIGNCFCTDYKEVDLTDLYLASLPFYEENKVDVENLSHDDKVRRGNIKCRMRMIYLYNLSAEHKGLIIDNDNLTEWMCGFWTINGDKFDLCPLADLFKTEVYELAKWVRDNWTLSQAEKDAINGIIDIVPTDGLGISSSDVEQFGCDNYDQVDNILIKITKGNGLSDDKINYTYKQMTSVQRRNKNSEFKRNWPFKVKLI